MDSYIQRNNSEVTRTDLIRIEERAAMVNTRPFFGIDFQPLKGKEHNKDREVKTLLPAIPGTFYDLLSPPYSKKDEAALKKQQKADAEAARRAVGDLTGGDQAQATEKQAKGAGGDPRYSYTFKALHTAVTSKLLSAIYMALPADFRNYKAPEVTDSSLRSYFASGGSFSATYKFIRVKKVGTDFLISLPVATFSASSLLTECTKDIPYAGTTYEDKKRAATYAIVAALKQHGFKIDRKVWMFTLPKEKIATKMPSNYELASAFYAKYVTGYSVYDTGLTDPTSRPDGGENIEVTAFDAAARRYVVCADVKLPAEEAQYYVQLAANKIKQSDILGFFSNWYNKGIRANSGFPTFTHSIETILVKNSAYQPKPRVDKYGLALTPDNHLLYIPKNVNKIKEYSDAVALLTQDDTGTSTYSNTTIAHLPINQLLYVDWVNQKLVFSGENGQIMVEDIESNHSMPVSNYTSWYAAQVAEQGDEMNALLRLGEKIETALGTTVPTRTSQLDDILGNGYIDHIRNFLTNINVSAYNRVFGTGAFQINDCTIIDYLKGITSFLSLANMELAQRTNQTLDPNSTEFLNCYPVLMKDVFTKTVLPFAPIQAMIEALAGAVPSEDDWLRVINECKSPAFSTMGQIALFKTIQSFADIAELQRENQMVNAPYLTQDVGITEFIPKLKNADGLAGLKPHQRKVAGMLAKHPKFAVVAVQAGGGKTILTIQDILSCLADKVVKKPLILCPAHLVKDYVAEALYVSHGKLNTIVFDTPIFRAYTSVNIDNKAVPGVSDFTQLKELCDNAPINTIFCIGYDSIASTKPQVGVYGTETDNFLPKLEFLRSLNFDGVWMDESHKLKGLDSKRVQVIESLISEIPIRRLLTGTIVPNTLHDLVKQVGMMAPNILGNEKQFTSRFFEYIEGPNRGGGKWVPKAGAERDIRDYIKQSCAYINIQRKEWQSALPEMVEILITEEMSDAQRRIYDILIERAVEEIQQGIGSDDGEDEDEDAPDDAQSVFDTDDDEALERMFSSGSAGKNLSAVEAFLSNPIAVEEGDKELKGEDRVSPKAKAVVQILKKHLFTRQYCAEAIAEANERLARGFSGTTRQIDAATQNTQAVLDEANDLMNRLDNPAAAKADPVYPGKILVFCNTKAAVNGICSALDNYKENGVHIFAGKFIKYDAENKADHEKNFKENDRVRVLVGIRNSLEEGLNLQIADTLIRVDNVWTPGSAEQGMSRINRPNFKGKESRKKIYVYSIMVNRSIDVLKTAKLTSKTVTVSKFYAAGTEDESKYVGLGLDDQGNQIEPIKISFDNLRLGLTLEEMEPYWKAYEDLRGVERQIAEEWKARQPPGSLDDVPVVHDGTLPGSKLLAKVPYITGMSLFNSVDLGLKPLLTYKREKEEKFTKADIEAGKTFDVEGLRVHTAFGDGEIVNLKTRGRMTVKLANGSKVNVLQGAAFVITKRTTSSIEMLNQLSKQTGLQVQDVQLRHFLDVKTKQDAETKRSKRDAERAPAEDPNEIFQDTADRSAKEIAVRATRINDMLAIVIPSNDANADISQFKENGFTVTPLYSFVEVKNPKQLNGFIEEMVKAQNRSNSGVEFKPADIDMWENVLQEYKRNKQFIVKPNTFSNIKNFLLERRRPIQSGMVRPMPLVKDHKLYICLDLVKHSQSTAAMKKVQMMATKVGLGAWKSEQPDMISFCTNKAEAKSKLKALQRDGWTITDPDQFQEDLESLIARGKTPSSDKDKAAKTPKTTLKVKPKVTRKAEKEKVKPKTTLRKVMKTKGKK